MKMLTREKKRTKGKIGETAPRDNSFSQRKTKKVPKERRLGRRKEKLGGGYEVDELEFFVLKGGKNEKRCEEREKSRGSLHTPRKWSTSKPSLFEKGFFQVQDIVTDHRIDQILSLLGQAHFPHLPPAKSYRNRGLERSSKIPAKCRSSIPRHQSS